MVETKDAIYFNKKKNEFQYMSMFSNSKFKEDDLIFNCCYQYVIYMKLLLFDPFNNKLIDKLLKEKEPSNLKKLNKLIKNIDDKLWEKNKYDIIVMGYELIFNQNVKLKKKILKTKNKQLYKISKNDRELGIGFNTKNALKTDKKEYGQNLLGKALMEVRNDFYFIYNL